MFALSNALNPDVVKTALDKVFFQDFNTKPVVGLVTADSSDVFRVERVDRAAVIQQVYGGTPLWENKAEEQDVPSIVPRITNTKTDLVTEFAQSVDITRWFYMDNQFGVVERLIRDMARKGRRTRDRAAFAIFRNAFTTTLTADGASFVSDTHTTISGVVVDNKITNALSESSLNTAIVMLQEQVGQSGVIEGGTPAILLVPPALFKLAVEITESEYRSGTANNDINVYSTKYGIKVAMSPWLGAAAGGSDTAWFLLADNHSVMRYVREDVWTELVDWKYQRNNNYIYKGGFREVPSVADYIGVVGSTGLT